jgi:NAD-dependent deacetylase
VDEPFARGVEALRSGDPRAAVALLQPLARSPRGSGEVHYHLALALRLHGDRSAALAAMRRAVALLPSLAAPQAQLGALLHVQGDLPAALACYRTAVALDPTHAVSWYFLAVGLVQADAPAEGLASLERALALGLPPLLAERALGQLAELRLPGRIKPPSLCSAPMFFEILGPAPRPDPPMEAGRVSGDLPRIVALTGAGISAGSGLATRKDLWERYPRDEAVSVWRFHENPAMLWEVIGDFLGDGAHSPCEAHRALARLPGLAGILTQNVDGLHQRAHREEHGVEAPYPVIELHGTLARTLCHRCGRDAGRSAQEHLRAALPPRCVACGGVVRPDVVLFGEPVAARALGAAAELARSCDVLLVVGCAMDVAPASELPRIARKGGARVIEFKRTPSRLGRTLETLLWPGPASVTLPELERSGEGIEPGVRRAQRL